MKLGTENKKSVYALIGLGAFAAYMVYSQLLSGPPAYTPPVAPAVGDAAPGTTSRTSGPDISRASEQTSRSRNKTGEFHPKLRPKNKEERQDASAKDPSLRLDLLAKVMQVPPAGGQRDLFQISKTPPVKAAAPLDPAKEPKVARIYGPRAPLPPAPPPPPPPVKPPDPIPLRYYGFSAVHPDGKRTAYFHPNDNPEETLEADEGTVIKGRYRVVQIGVDKVLVEDTMQKQRQSLKIEPEITG